MGDTLPNGGGSEPPRPVIPSRPAPLAPRHVEAPLSSPASLTSRKLETKPEPVARPALAPVVPMTSVAVRFAVDPPPPIIKPRQEQAAPKPVEKRAEQIFTF